MAAPAPLRDNANGVLVTRTITYILRSAQDRLYNAAGRMVRAQSVTSTVVYTYTANGLRVAQNVAGAETTFTWDWASGVPELLVHSPFLYLVGYDTPGFAVLPTRDRGRRRL